MLSLNDIYLGFEQKKRICKNRFFRKEVCLLLTQAVKKNMVFAAWWTELEVLVQEILVWPVSHAFNMKDIIQHQRKSRENIGCCCFCASYGGCKRQNLIFFIPSYLLSFCVHSYVCTPVLHHVLINRIIAYLSILIFQAYRHFWNNVFSDQRKTYANSTPEMANSIGPTVIHSFVFRA